LPIKRCFWSKIGPFAAEISPCKDSGFGDFSVAVYKLAFRHFESFLKPKSRAKKSAKQVKIGQIVYIIRCFSSSDRGTWDIPIMLSATEDQNLLPMQK